MRAWRCGQWWRGVMPTAAAAAALPLPLPLPLSPAPSTTPLPLPFRPQLIPLLHVAVLLSRGARLSEYRRTVMDYHRCHQHAGCWQPRVAAAYLHLSSCARRATGCASCRQQQQAPRHCSTSLRCAAMLSSASAHPPSVWVVVDDVGCLLLPQLCCLPSPHCPLNCCHHADTC